MKKIYYIFFLSLVFNFASINPAHAQIKTALEFVQNIVDGAQGMVRQVMDQVNNAVTVTKQKITERKDQFKNNNTYKSLQKKADKAQEIANSPEAQARKDDLNDAKELASLIKQKEEKEEEYKAAQKTAQEDYDEKLKLSDQNVTVYQGLAQNDSEKEEEYKKKISEEEAKKTKLAAEFEESSRKLTASYNQEVAPIDAKIKQLTDKQADKAKSEALNQSAKALESKKSVTAEDVAEQSFLKEGEKINPETAEKIHKIRRKTAYNENVHMFSSAVAIKMGRKDSNQRAEDLVSLNQEQQTNIDALLVYTDTVVENIKVLSEYLELVIMDIKASSATEFSKSTDYKFSIEDEAKNLSKLNLCDYEYIPSSGGN